MAFDGHVSQMRPQSRKRASNPGAHQAEQKNPVPLLCKLIRMLASLRGKEKPSKASTASRKKKSVTACTQRRPSSRPVLVPHADQAVHASRWCLGARCAAGSESNSREKETKRKREDEHAIGAGVLSCAVAPLLLRGLLALLVSLALALSRLPGWLPRVGQPSGASEEEGGERGGGESVPSPMMPAADPSGLPLHRTVVRIDHSSTLPMPMFPMLLPLPGHLSPGGSQLSPTTDEQCRCQRVPVSASECQCQMPMPSRFPPPLPPLPPPSLPPASSPIPPITHRATTTTLSPSRRRRGGGRQQGPGPSGRGCHFSCLLRPANPKTAKK